MPDNVLPGQGEEAEASGLLLSVEPLHGSASNVRLKGDDDSDASDAIGTDSDTDRSDTGDAGVTDAIGGDSGSDSDGGLLGGDSDSSDAAGSDADSTDADGGGDRDTVDTDSDGGGMNPLGLGSDTRDADSTDNR